MPERERQGVGLGGVLDAAVRVMDQPWRRPLALTYGAEGIFDAVAEITEWSYQERPLRVRSIRL